MAKRASETAVFGGSFTDMARNTHFITTFLPSVWSCDKKALTLPQNITIGMPYAEPHVRVIMTAHRPCVA